MFGRSLGAENLFFDVAKSTKNGDFCVFSSKKQIELLNTHIEDERLHLLMDATFRTCPMGPFKQFLIIYARIHHQVICVINMFIFSLIVLHLFLTSNSISFSLFLSFFFVLLFFFFFSHRPFHLHSCSCREKVALLIRMLSNTSITMCSNCPVQRLSLRIMRWQCAQPLLISIHLQNCSRATFISHRHVKCELPK